MKTPILTIVLTLLCLAGCKKEDTAPKLITELRGGLYEDGSWARMPWHKVSLMKSVSNYPLPPALIEVASTYTNEEGKYHFKNVDFQSHESYYLYFHFDESKYYEHTRFDFPVYLYSDEERVNVLTGRATVCVKINSAESKTYTVRASRESSPPHYNKTYSLDKLKCEALKSDTVIISILNEDKSFSRRRYSIISSLHDTTYLEINF